MSLIDQIISLVVPYDCLQCGAEGNLICSDCSTSLLPAIPRCYRCQGLSAGYVTCEQCLNSTPLRSVRAAWCYQGAAKQLLWQLKFNGAQGVCGLLADQMIAGLPSYQAAIWMAVPTATGRVRRRGYDQAELLARELARRTGLPHWRGLVRTGQSEQIGAGREQRAEQLAKAFRVISPRLVIGRHIVLVDDVVTTGATLQAAARALAAAGAARIDATVFAQA